MEWNPPRPIDPHDDLTGFTSDEPSLDRYLVERALANHLAGFARCYVCTTVDHGVESLVGYYTLSAIAIERSLLPGHLRRNSPDPVPAILLGRLGVHTKVQNTGLGRFLVRDAILSTLAAAGHVGVRILLVHALNERVAQFYTTLDFVPSPTDSMHLYLSLADAQASLN